MGFYIVDQAIIAQQTATVGLGNELSLEIQQRTEAVAATNATLASNTAELRAGLVATADTAAANLEATKVQFATTVGILQASDTSQVASIEALGVIVDNNKTAIDTAVTALSASVDSKIGALSGLTTGVKTSAVSAINELVSTTALNKAEVLTALATEQARTISVTGTLSTLGTTDKSTLVGAINELRAGYLSSDATISASITALQNTVASNTTIRGAISSVSELATLVESDLKQGYMWSHKGANDLYMYIPESANGFDFKPEGWTGGFVIFGNIADITGAVSTLNASVVEGVTRLDARIDSVVTNLELVDQQITNRLATIEGTGEGSIAKVKSDLTSNLTGVSDTLTASINSNSVAITTASADFNTKLGELSGLSSVVKTNVVASINSVNTELTKVISDNHTSLTSAIASNGSAIATVGTELTATKADIIVRDFKVVRGRPLSAVAHTALNGLLTANAVGEFDLITPAIKGSGDLVQISFVTNNETDENGNTRFSIVSGYYASVVSGVRMKVLVDVFPEDFVGTQVVVDWYYQAVSV